MQRISLIPRRGGKILEKLASEKAEDIEVMNADQGYCGTYEDKCYERLGIHPLILKRKDTGQGKRKTALEKKHWKKNREKLVTPKRWIVERTFAWLNGYRRLARDYEKKISHSETMIYLAMTQLMLRRQHANLL